MRAYASSAGERVVVSGGGDWCTIGQIALLTVLGVSSGLLCSVPVTRSRENHWGYAADRIFLGTVSTLAIDYGKGLWGAASTGDASQGAGADNSEAGDGGRGTLPRIRLLPASRPTVPTLWIQAHSAVAPNWARHSGTRVSEGFFELMDVPFATGKSFPYRISRTLMVLTTSSSTNRWRANSWPGQDPLQRTLYARYQWMQERAIRPGSRPFTAWCGITRRVERWRRPTTSSSRLRRPKLEPTARFSFSCVTGRDYRSFVPE